MDKRLRFVAGLLEGEQMNVLCREFDISRTHGVRRASMILSARVGAHRPRPRRARA